MADTAALVALVVAAIALLIAGGQLAQQLLATAYVIRKCDRIVTGGLTNGAKRKWHWRQFRFTVQYQSITFALPAPLYTSLGISPTVQVDSSRPTPEEGRDSFRGSGWEHLLHVDAASKRIWDRASQLRSTRTASQSCFISFLQDLVMSNCLQPSDVRLNEESGDRIPEDLTVAPTRVDAITVLLSCLALEMLVLKYAPNSGEISLAGGVGSISSSSHPVLGGLIHYNIFNEPAIGSENSKRHGQAMRNSQGVWANTVFGRFRDRSYRPEFLSLEVLMEPNVRILKQCGWPENPDQADTLAGAASFMAFGHVDLFEAVPPSVVRPYCAHFAEFIVLSHLFELAELRSKEKLEPLTLPPHFYEHIIPIIQNNGASSPYLDSYLPTCLLGTPAIFELIETQELFSHIGEHNALFDPDLMACLDHLKPSSDPSTYVPMAAAWQVILRADLCAVHISRKYSSLRPFDDVPDKIIAAAISTLATSGPPSWGGTSSYPFFLRNWPETFTTVGQRILREETSKDEYSKELDEVAPNGEKWVLILTRLRLLRSAYYTIMMRAAGDIGPGLTVGAKPDTAMMYMA